MTNADPKTNRQRVQNALADLLEADEHSNSYRYFRASDVADRDSELSSTMVGSYLPEIEDEEFVPEVGQEVRFEVVWTTNGPRAMDVRRL